MSPTSGDRIDSGMQPLMSASSMFRFSNSPEQDSDRLPALRPNRVKSLDSI